MLDARWLESLERLLPAARAAVIVLALGLAVHFVLGRFVKGRHLGQVRISVWVILSLIGLLAVTASLPMDMTLRAQVLGLGGVLIVALSSTTLIGNALAGVLLRIVGNFELGDWVRVDNDFGRVTERGLFHTEIATEDRDLTTLPNLYLATKPLTVVRASGTFVTAEVSLGYDVPQERVKEVLQQAAESVTLGDPPQGLRDAFVHVRELGDFAVTYRVGALLENVKLLISARSAIRSAMLGALHEAGIEIVSPSFMNTRALASDLQVLPATAIEVPPSGENEAPPRHEAAVEDVATDKADESLQAKLSGDEQEELEADKSDTESRRRQSEGNTEPDGIGGGSEGETA